MHRHVIPAAPAVLRSSRELVGRGPALPSSTFLFSSLRSRRCTGTPPISSQHPKAGSRLPPLPPPPPPCPRPGVRGRPGRFPCPVRQHPPEGPSFYLAPNSQLSRRRFPGQPRDRGPTGPPPHRKRRNWPPEPQDDPILSPELVPGDIGPQSFPSPWSGSGARCSQCRGPAARSTIALKPQPAQEQLSG